MSLTCSITFFFLCFVILCNCFEAQAAKLDQSDPEADREIQGLFGPGASGAYMARNGMVTTASHQATLAGLETLRAGGNAFDAAAVVQFVLTVTEPYASGIGGGLFAVAYISDTGEVINLDGRESAPAMYGPDLFIGENSRVEAFSSRINGGKAVGVPGTLAAIAYLLETYGTISLSEAVKPAVSIAENGFRVTEPFARNLEAHWNRLAQFSETQKLFSGPNGGPLKAGDLFRNPALAETLTLIGHEGIDAFYEGEIGQDILDAVNQSAVNKGNMTALDLANYKPITRKPIVSTYKEFDVYGMNMPSSGGATLALMLNMLEEVDFGKERSWTSEDIHQLIDIQNLAFADRNRYMADADYADVPTMSLADKAYAKVRAKELSPDNALNVPVAAGKPFGAKAKQTSSITEESATTTHFTIVDRERNVLAVTSTIEQHFGSGLVVPGRGFLLNNQVTDFDAKGYDSKGNLLPNAIEGGKRPRSSMTPTIIFKDEKPYLAVGSPGGSRIIGISLNVILNVINRNMEIQEAINAPRIIARNRPAELEAPLYHDDALRSELEARGFEVKNAQAIGSVQAIMIDEDNWLHGAADPRREGLAIGF